MDAETLSIPPGMLCKDEVSKKVCILNKDIISTWDTVFYGSTNDIRSLEKFFVRNAEKAFYWFNPDGECELHVCRSWTINNSKLYTHLISYKSISKTPKTNIPRPKTVGYNK